MRQPNSRSCFVCGLENPHGLGLKFYETGEGEVAADYVVPEHFQGYPGVVHGGIVAAMLDEICGRAHMVGVTQKTRFMYTARLKVRYRQHVPTGKPLRLVGRARKRKSRSATATGEVYGDDGQLLAEAEAILVDLPELAVDDSRLEALGWKVYED